jgi:hypothetical protein
MASPFDVARFTAVSLVHLEESGELHSEIQAELCRDVATPASPEFISLAIGGHELIA